MVRRVIAEGLVDYFAVDVKQSESKYEGLCGSGASFDKTMESAKLIIKSGIDHEFRTTVAKGEHTVEDIGKIARGLTGARRYFLQNYRPGHVLDEKFRGASFEIRELVEFVEKASAFVSEVKMRT